MLSQDLFASAHEHRATSSPLLAHLNDEQRAAVTLPACHALILAGAGSGKTSVLTTRIAWLLQNGYATPGGILAVTFTNKAAKEMTTRLSAMLPVSVRGMWIGTFHGLCNRLLRAHHQAAGLPQTFQILDTQDQLSAIKRLSKRHNIDEERFAPKMLQYFIAGCKEDGHRPADVPVRDSDTRQKIEFYQLYEEQCQREGVVDFGELMLRSFELLRDNVPLREHYQRRFRYVLVDEFQDTNRLQYAWLKQLAGQGGTVPGASVMAVGDDDQSIYAFRGARVGNMADFVREFEVQHQIKLEQNYRSFSNILDSANELISHNSQRLGKNLRTTQGAGEPVRIHEATSDYAEAQWMVDEIRQLVASDGVRRQEIAVLYRSNAQSRVMESALFNAGVPYRVYGGLRFFERAEIKHALAYLRLLENPHDDTSFMRVVNFPARSIGARTLEVLQDNARSANCSLHDAVPSVPGKAGGHLTAFVRLLQGLREQTQGQRLRTIMEHMLQASGLREHYRLDKEGADRLENLDELLNAAESFVTQEGFGRDAVALPIDEYGAPLPPRADGLIDGALPRSALLPQLLPTAAGALPEGMVDIDTGETLSPLAAFLTHAALEAGDNQAQAGQEAVQLMTVHSSKGLEFDVVMIGGVEEGLFPHDNAMNDRGGVEEERRLMYVAITRARQRLYLSYTQTRMLHGKTRYNVKSRFLDELPAHALKWMTVPPPRHAATGASGYSSWRQPTSAHNAYPGHERSPVFASPPVPPQKQSPSHGLRVGLTVFHSKFGQGRVTAIEGSGDDARAEVDFSRHGKKWLALSVAKLTVVE